jgi:TM2 domain-containing membrane protein YozV
MKGQILDFSIQTNAGVISGEDGKRYKFTGADWREATPPQRGMHVDFEGNKSDGKNIYRVPGVSPGTGKNKVAAGLLAIFLGGWGIHKFYLGYNGPGLVFLLVNTIGFAVTWIMLFIPNIVLGVIALVEGILYLTKSDEEFEQTYVMNKKEWF